MASSIVFDRWTARAIYTDVVRQGVSNIAAMLVSLTVAYTAFAAPPRILLIAQSRLSQFDPYTVQQRQMGQPFDSNTTPVSVNLSGAQFTAAATAQPRSVAVSFAAHDNPAVIADSEGRIENLAIIFEDSPALRSIDSANQGYVDVLLRLRSTFSVACTGPYCAAYVNAMIFVRHTLTSGGGSICVMNGSTCGSSGAFESFLPANGRVAGETSFSVPARIYFSAQPFLPALTIEIASMYVTTGGLSADFPAESDAGATVTLELAADTVRLPDGSSLQDRGISYTVGTQPLGPPRRRSTRH